jgi:hypothetical protein
MPKRTKKRKSIVSKRNQSAKRTKRTKRTKSKRRYNAQVLGKIRKRSKQIWKDHKSKILVGGSTAALVASTVAINKAERKMKTKRMDLLVQTESVNNVLMFILSDLYQESLPMQYEKSSTQYVSGKQLWNYWVELSKNTIDTIKHGRVMSQVSTAQDLTEDNIMRQLKRNSALVESIKAWIENYKNTTPKYK